MSNKSALTPWFDGAVKPVRKGIYITEFDGWPEEGFSRWNGRQWSHQFSTPAKAALAGVMGAVQDKRWRGLAVNPLDAGQVGDKP